MNDLSTSPASNDQTNENITSFKAVKMYHNSSHAFLILRLLFITYFSLFDDEFVSIYVIVYLISAFTIRSVTLQTHPSKLSNASNISNNREEFEDSNTNHSTKGKRK